jgi:hypothetical protein
MKQSTNDPPPKRSALASPKADLRELKGNSRATVAELQSFLAELKGKNPQEMLGVVASSHLVRSLILSTTLVFAAIVIFTVVPYFLGEKPNVESGFATRPPAPTFPEPTPAKPEPTPIQAREPAPEPAPLSKLGVGEELTAPPNKNPLENTGDDFLKDLE